MKLRHVGAGAKYNDAKLFDDPVGSWEGALNLSERKRLRTFKEIKPGCDWDLGQSDKKMILSELTGPLHCIMKNTG